MRNENENVKRCIAKRKQLLTEIMGNKCCVCGFNSYIEALEFHHVDPDSKSFNLSSGGLMKILPAQLSELKKCVLVCANCHRGLHYNHIQLPNDWQKFYNEEIAQNKLDEYENSKIKKQSFCIDCGALITFGAERCNKCASLAQRTCERPSREELKKLIRTMPFTKIGAMYKVSDNAIRKWCKLENLPTKKYDIQSKTDEEWSAL